MKIAIVAALDSELAHLSAHLQSRNEVPLSGTMMYTGTFYDHTIALVKLSVGKVNAACRTQAVIDVFSPDRVINTGIAGSLHNDVCVLDTVIGEKCVYHDFDPSIMERFYPYQSSFKGDESLLEIAEIIGKEIDFRLHKGTIATGDVFVSDAAAKHQIARQTGALCVEMEGTAVAHTAFINDIPCLVIRTISDQADDNAEMDYAEFEQKAADQSASFILSILKKLY